MQQLWPRRTDAGGWRRRTTNLAIVLLDTGVLRIGFPFLAIEAAIIAEQNSAGILRGLPPAVAVVVGILILDLVIYWQHRILHAVPLLWRLHRMHHADTGFDVTTGVRFHPLEIVLSMLLKLAAIAILGIVPLAVLSFEIMLSTGALFTHANLRLPARVERALRLLVVTPDMHRIHHSWHRDETNSNFSFHLSIWDRLFRSYRAEPRDGQLGITIGLHEFRGRREQHLLALLLNPFRSTPTK